MFIGHSGVALAAKRAAPKTSLGTLILAAQFADLLWPILLLLGLEQVRIATGIMRMTPLDFTYYPISHSLVGQVGWGVALGFLYYAARRYTRGAYVVGACVVSHWFLDALMHRPDMPVFPNGPFLGLGLWNSLPATLIAEGSVFAFGLAVYLRSTRATGRIGSLGLWSLMGLLVILWLGAIFGPPPPSVRVLAITSLFGVLFLPWAVWADRHRQYLLPSK